MYAKEDDYTATTGMKSYYFRGAVNNNWVQFGQENGKDIYWRIIRINGDGSIRMIYSGTTDPKTDSSVTGSNGVYMTGEGTQISTSQFNSISNRSEHVGYMYTDGEQHGNSTSSDIKNTLENWYARTTLKDNALVSQDQIFCNDRSVTDGTWSSWPTYLTYATYTRLSASMPSPQLSCPTESDKFTSKKSSIGNKALEYPVGLITVDEVTMAGGVYGINNNLYYLYNGQYLWTLSPSYFDSYHSLAHVWIILPSGALADWLNVTYTFDVRPVINLNSDITISSGDGTALNPYVIQTEVIQ